MQAMMMARSTPKQTHPAAAGPATEFGFLGFLFVGVVGGEADASV